MKNLKDALCCICHTNKCRTNGIGKNNIQKYKKHCRRCEKVVYNLPDKNPNRRLGYRLLKKESCEECGFVPVHPCQLDVHHKDNNLSNNSETNLKTLCANCHRLVSFKETKRNNKEFVLN